MFYGRIKRHFQNGDLVGRYTLVLDRLASRRVLLI